MGPFLPNIPAFVWIGLWFLVQVEKRFPRVVAGSVAGRRGVGRGLGARRRLLCSEGWRCFRSSSKGKIRPWIIYSVDFILVSLLSVAALVHAGNDNRFVQESSTAAFNASVASVPGDLKPVTQQLTSQEGHGFHWECLLQRKFTYKFFLDVGYDANTKTLKMYRRNCDNSKNSSPPRNQMSAGD